MPQLTLTDQEKQDILRYLEAGKLLPEKYLEIYFVLLSKSDDQVQLSRFDNYY